MVFGDASSSGLYLDIGILAIVFCILLFEIAGRLKAKKKMAEIEQKIASLAQFQSDISATFQEEVGILKEMVLEKTNPLVSKVNELVKKADAMNKRNKAIRRELEQEVGPLRASIDDTSAKFRSSNDAMRKIVQQGKSEIEVMTKDIDAFSEEIQKMKDFIRERMIDLEL
jgi:hypothetical protein